MTTHAWTIAALLFAVAACAGSTDGPSGRAAGAPSMTPSTQQDTADHAGDYRSQSYALKEMADRRQLEADLLAQDLGQDHPSVEKKRRLAEDLRAAAEEADRTARDLQRKVPHGMVQ